LVPRSDSFIGDCHVTFIDLVAPGPRVTAFGSGGSVYKHSHALKTEHSPATVGLLRTWLDEREGGPEDHLFPARGGGRMSRDALERRIARHVATAAPGCPSLAAKKVTAHVLRHTAAMRLLLAGVDTSAIALWLGHEQVETTQIYLHANLAIKEQALERTRPAHAEPGRYRPADSTIAFLEAL
jgi:integrase